MKILVLSDFIHQTKAVGAIPPDVLPRVYEEYRTLFALEASGLHALKDYLKNRNGKKMRGREKVFKYRLTAEDRILYSYGKYFPWICEDETDAIVLMAYAKHENQGEIAAKFDFNKERPYAYLSDIVAAMDELNISSLQEEGLDIHDLYAVGELISAPDYMRNHVKYELSEETMMALPAEKTEEFLLREEGKHITDYFGTPKPTLIQGGAGTGKTRIAVHMLDNFNRNRDGVRCVYFTQSRPLRLRVKDMYDAIKETKEGNAVHFEDINDFCLDHLKISRKKLVQTREFMEFLHSRNDLVTLCQKHGIAEQDVWTEIRGTLKGAMSSEWTRTAPMPQDKFGRGIESLVRKEYFWRDPVDQQRITLFDSIDKMTQKAKKDESLSAEERECLSTALNYFGSFDATISTLTKEQYLRLTEEDTTLDAALREVIWTICLAYEKNLQMKGLYDENDLVRLMFQHHQGDMAQYDFLIVDEVQDYTELQIFLLRSMCKTADRIVFAGDRNQIINPTTFREGRLRMLFKKPEGGTYLHSIQLKKNYRSQKQIVNAANRLSDLRRKTNHMQSQESEQIEEGVRNGAEPLRLKHSQKNLRGMLWEVVQYPRAAVLVADEQNKQEVIRIIGQRKYEEAGREFVFTVSEIKGMEYAYIVCYNLIGRYVSEWKTILENKEKKTKNRYYFNLLYVAMTRAQEYLCLIDDTLVQELEEQLDFRTEEKFDAETFHLTKLGNQREDWILQAMEFEQAGRYKDALKIYRKANAPQHDIYRCELSLALDQQDFERGVQYGILSQNTEELQRCLKESLSKEAKTLAELYVSLTEHHAIPKKYRPNFAQLVDFVFKTFQPEERASAKQILREAYIGTLYSLAESINRIAGDIE